MVEHDLHEGLTTLKGRETGLDRAGIEVKCQSCQAISEFEPNRVAQNCEFCGSAALVPYEDVKEAIRPESLLPMKVSETRVREDMRRWYGSRWFAPNALGQKAMTDTLRGLYIPYWTFDAQVGRGPPNRAPTTTQPRATPKTVSARPGRSATPDGLMPPESWITSSTIN